MKISRVLLALTMLAGLATAPAWAADPPTLGSANQFGVLSFYGLVNFYPVSELETAYVSPPPTTCPGEAGCTPDTGAVRIGLSGIDYLAGDAIASLSKSEAIINGPEDTTEGECVTGGGGVLLGPLSVCVGGIDKSGTNSKVTTLLPDAITDAAAFSATLAAGTETQTLPAIFLNKGQSYTITATTGGLNLISLPSIITKGYNTITIDAAATDTVVLNIGSASSPGQLVLGPYTQIVLTGGITPNQVLFNVLGYGAPVTIDRYSLVNGTILAPDDAISVSTELGPNYKNYKNWGTINGALIAGKDIYIGCLVKIYFNPFTAPPTSTSGACVPSTSLAVLVQGDNVSAYVPKAAWLAGTTGIDAIQIEGSGTPTTKIPTAVNVNSCSSNPNTGQTVCTSNATDVYLLSGTSLVTTLTSGATGATSFSGGNCETCGVAMNPATNQAVLTEGNSTGGGEFQFLDLNTNTFQTPFNTQATFGLVSEEILVDPTRNLLLSANEANDYEIVNIANPTSPAFFENSPTLPTGFGNFDASGEDCWTGIALATDEDGNTDEAGGADLFLADLTQATFTSGSPAGTWTAGAAEAFDSLPEFANLSNGPCTIGVAQGLHTAIVTGEFGGNGVGAVLLPSTSGSGTPAIQDYVECPLPNEPNGDVFSQGLDPHTVAAYVSPNSGDAIGLSADGGALDSGTPTYVAVIDLTKMLNTTIVPRTAGTHECSAGVLPSSVVSYVGPLP